MGGVGSVAPGGVKSQPVQPGEARYSIMQRLHETNGMSVEFLINNIWLVLIAVISGGALSPRGDWRAPSDGLAEVWLAEVAQVPRK